ncbi:hypothetical protein [Allosalinactinospora lopnorensis]|uniref:hypothetical protein n=1 Tax=Allosalinactinospora lopnorensis TaxID=1352348 RepID=UPI001F17DBFA|nr:hypothetical protein [Allosalinactinospora lopnorensis]
MVHDRGALSRRMVIAGAIAALTAANLSGCQGERWYPSEISPDEYVLRGTIAGKKRTIARYEATLEAGEGPAELLERLLVHHRHHLRALRDRLPDHGTDEPWDPENSPDAVPDPGSPVSVSGLRVAEESAAGERPRQLAKISDPGLAQLIAAVGACEIGHAHILKEES